MGARTGSATSRRRARRGPRPRWWRPTRCWWCSARWSRRSGWPASSTAARPRTRRCRVAAPGWCRCCSGWPSWSPAGSDRCRSPGAPVVRDLLDGPLAPLRNVHKLDAMVRLPLVVGLAHALVRLELPRASGWTRARARVVAVLVVVAAAAPLVAGQLAPRGAFFEVPGYWRDAAAYLDDHSRGGTTLLLPGEGFGRFAWGRTVDEPVQTLMRTPWATRQQAGPLAGTGSVRVLDAVEEAVAQGRPVPGLADLLASAGVDQVLLRTDLDWAGTGGPRPALVHRSLATSPGLTRVATFGVISPGGREGDLVVDDGLQVSLPTLEVFRVDRDVQRVTAPLVGDLVSVGGRRRHRPRPGCPRPPARPPRRAGGRHRQLHPRTGPGRRVGHRPAADDVVRRVARQRFPHASRPDEVLDPPGVAADLRSLPDAPETVAVLDGVRAVTASSSASTPSALIDRSQLRHPFSAVDGRTGTVWSSGTTTPGGGRQWWRVDLEQPRDVSGLEVRLGSSAVAKQRLTAITVVTERGEHHHARSRRRSRTFTPPVPPGADRLGRAAGRVVRRVARRARVVRPRRGAVCRACAPTGRWPCRSTAAGPASSTASCSPPPPGTGPAAPTWGPGWCARRSTARPDEEDGRLDRTLVGTGSADGTAAITLDAALTLSGRADPRARRRRRGLEHLGGRARRLGPGPGRRRPRHVVATGDERPRTDRRRWPGTRPRARSAACGWCSTSGGRAPSPAGCGCRAAGRSGSPSWSRWGAPAPGSRSRRRSSR